MPVHRYQMASDLTRDGMALEVWNEAEELIVEIFYSDRNQAWTVTTFKNPVDLVVIEEAILQARHRLPPSAR